jgi:Pectate lyase superfamily protein
MRSMTLALGLWLGLCCSTLGQAIHGPGSVGQAHYDPDLFDVRGFGAVGDGQTDDSAAIASAATAAIANSLRGQPSALYFPSGAYRLVRALPMWTVPISVFGDGREQSVIRVDSAFSGDVFSWSEVWAAGNYGTDTISPLTAQKAGVEVRGIRITGTRTSANVQNAFVFYDRADQIFMQDVDVVDLTGRALYSGVSRTKPQAYMRESHFNNLRFVRCGSADAAVVDFDSRGNGPGSNEISVDGLDIMAPGSVGLILHSAGTGLALMRFVRLRVDGQGGGGTAALVELGPTALSPSNNIDFEQTELINPPAGFAAMRFTAMNLPLAPFWIRLQGKIAGEAANGKGIVIDAGRSLSFDLTELDTRDVNVTVASSQTVGGTIVFDGHGQEGSWTRSIDVSSIAKVKRPVPHMLEQF